MNFNFIFEVIVTVTLLLVVSFVLYFISTIFFTNDFVTVTVHVAVFPLAVFTVIVVVPFAIAVTFPSCVTVATSGLLLVHVKVFSLLALLGVIVAVNVNSFVPFKSNVFVVSLNDILSGSTSPVSVFTTVTLHVAVFPLAVVTVIVVVPFAIAVTFPFFVTVATSGLLLAHVRLVFALLGVIVAVNVNSFVPFKSNVFAVSLNDILSGSTSPVSVFTTVTLHVAVFPLAVVTVIVVVPFATAVTFPSCVTVATSGLLLVQVKVFSLLALLGVIVAVNVNSFVPFKSNVFVVSLNDTLSGSTTSELPAFVTITLQVAVFPLAVVAVIVHSPAFPYLGPSITTSPPLKT